MIQITAYIRDEEDLRLWKELGNKTQFLHDALHVQNSTLRGTMYPKGEVESTSQVSPVPIPENPLLENVRDKINNAQVDEVVKTNAKLCAHGQIKGKCLVKGCPFNTRF